MLDEILVEMNGRLDVYFFDEIQNIPGWERFVRTKLDGGFHVTITGSNATMMSKDLGTKLTGRHLRYELSPFSYNEMLAFTGAQAGPESFRDYLTCGGFPEFLQSGRVEMLQQLFTDIVHRDILVRYNVRNDKQYIAFATHLLTNAGKEFSFTNLKNSFALGSTNTAIDHVSYLENAYLVSIVPRLEHSYKKQLIAPKKLYACDTGLARAVSASYSRDGGRVLENAVFTHLKRRGDEVFYHKSTGECDFLTRARGTFTGAVQVCTTITSDTRARKFQGMVDGLRATGLDRGTIVTLEDDDKISLEGKPVRIVPAWRWMAGMA